jgi:hypothetical protein
MEVCVTSHAGKAVVVVALVLAATSAAQAQSPSDPSPAGNAAAKAPAPATSRGLFSEPAIIGDAFQFVEHYGENGETSAEKTSGFYPELGEMVTGAGWISAGPGYRLWLFNDRAVLYSSAAISWRAYKMLQTRLEVPTLANDTVLVGTQVRWHDYTQVSYWGEGPDSLAANRTEYRQKAVNVVGYGGIRPMTWLTFVGRIGWLTNLEISAPAGSFGRDNPGTQEVFGDDPVYQLAEQPAFLYGEASAVADTRDHRGYATRGGVYRASWTRFSDRDSDSFSFVRYEAEAAHFMPFFDDNLVVALRGWLVGTASAAGQHVPFYLEPSLGGNNTLRGFNNYRFHDRNVAVVNAETRVAIWEHLDAAVFFDAGNVARTFDALNLERTSYGVGVRLHSGTTNFARVDVGRGSGEGWNFLFTVHDPFKLSRHTKRTAPTPFAP